MNEAVFTTIAATGFTVAFFHAAIPTHWLPFVLTSRAQGWDHAKTLAITAIAGAGHVMFTAFLGLVLTLLGFALHGQTAQWLPRIAGGGLLLFGLFYVFRQLVGKVHGHSRVIGEDPRVHAAHSCADDKEDAIVANPASLVSDRVAIASLLALLTFSPCESFVPFYIFGLRYGWLGFLLLTAILSIATLGGMVAFTWLTLIGMKRIALRRLERYELGIMGLLLCAVGVLIILFEK